MAKIKTTTVENVPCWAADYFVNAETSGLNEEDLALVHEYERKLERQGLRLISPIEDTRNEFCACPAFGKACDTEDWTAEVLPPDRIVFRKYWNKSDKKWTPIAFMPDTEANPGSIMSYEHCGQHAEAASLVAVLHFPHGTIQLFTALFIAEPLPIGRIGDKHDVLRLQVQFFQITCRYMDIILQPGLLNMPVRQFHSRFVNIRP